MKITIKKQILVDCLKNVNNLIDENNLNPVLSAVNLKTENGKLLILATNGSSSYLQTIDNVDITENGNILVRAKFIYSIISKINQEEITLNQIDEGVMQIKTPNFCCEINLIDSTAFPVIKFDYEGWNKIVITKDTLLNINERVVPFVSSTNLNQYAITNGILFNAIDEKNMECVASDSFRIGYYKFDYEGSPIKFVIGTEVIKSALNILSTSKNKTVELFFNNKNCILKVENILMSFSLFGDNYPNIITALLAPQKLHFTVKLQDLHSALSRGSVFVSKEKRPTANFKIEGNKLIIKFVSSESGNSFEELEIENSNVEKYEVKLNQRLFSDLISTIKSNTITFNFNGEFAPIVITSENPYFLNLILPIR